MRPHPGARTWDPTQRKMVYTPEDDGIIADRSKVSAERLRRRFDVPDETLFAEIARHPKAWAILVAPTRGRQTEGSSYRPTKED